MKYLATVYVKVEVETSEPVPLSNVSAKIAMAFEPLSPGGGITVVEMNVTAHETREILPEPFVDSTTHFMQEMLDRLPPKREGWEG